MKKNVPNCKECSYHWDICVKDYGLLNEHYCHWWKACNGKTEMLKTGFKGSDGKRITGKDYQTSPKWCPKRTTN